MQTVSELREQRKQDVYHAFVKYALDHPEINDVLSFYDRTFLNETVMREDMQAISVAWLLGMDEWKHFVTLTFRKDVHPDEARYAWRQLLVELNREVAGLHYTNVVGHCYFSYVLAMEYQKRQVAHFHVVCGSSINYQKIHDFWGQKNGFANIQPIREVADCVEYVTKYMLKGGDIVPYMASRIFVPRVLPSWWF